MLCIARTMTSQDVRLSVRLSVSLSHAGILSKLLNISSISSNYFHSTSVTKQYNWVLAKRWQCSASLHSWKVMRSEYLENKLRSSRNAHIECGNTFTFFVINAIITNKIYLPAIVIVKPAAVLPCN